MKIRLITKNRIENNDNNVGSVFILGNIWGVSDQSNSKSFHYGSTVKYKVSLHHNTKQFLKTQMESLSFSTTFYYINKERLVFLVNFKCL